MERDYQSEQEAYENWLQEDESLEEEYEDRYIDPYEGAEDVDYIDEKNNIHWVEDRYEEEYGDSPEWTDD